MPACCCSRFSRRSVPHFCSAWRPRWRASKTDVVSGLKEETANQGRAGARSRLTNALLVGQVAFSLVCLVTAVLFFRAIQRAWTIDPGFRTTISGCSW